MRISDWSSDVCSSDLHASRPLADCLEWQSARRTPTRLRVGTVGQTDLHHAAPRRRAPYTGNRAHRASTSPRTLASVASTSPPLLMVSTMSAIQPATCAISAPLKPRVVLAGEPSSRPEVTNGDFGSFGTEFLLTVMCALPRDRKSTRLNSSH